MSSPRKLRADGHFRLLATWACFAMAGCGLPADDGPTKPTTPAGPPPVSLRVTDARGYGETLAKLRGKVVLVDFWATWCAPCVEQFPHTVELHRKYQDTGLAVVGVSLNTPEEEPQVREFLERHEAGFENLLSNYASGVKAVAAFALPGPIPCYRVYDRSGELRGEFVVDPRAARQFTPDDIEAAVVELL
jgi:thiol-disulfide isomerase/thioredoxin